MPAHDKKFQLEASTLGKPESDVVRELQTCYDLAEKLGLIGCAKSTPKDLSTNRKHFEGFGKS